MHSIERRRYIRGRGGRHPQEEKADLHCIRCKQKGSHDASTCKLPWEKIEQRRNQQKGKTDDSDKGKTPEYAHYIEAQCNIGVNEDLFNASLASSKNDWLLDSGATCHMTHRRDFFEDFTNNVDGAVYFADQSKIKPSGLGTIRLKLPGLPDFLLDHVLYLPQLKRNLLSLVHIRQQGHSIHMFDGKLEVDVIESRGGQMTADGNRRRTPGGILWNILKSREPEAYKEIMQKGKEFEKQLRKENGKPRITDLVGQLNNKRSRTDSNDSDMVGQPNNKISRTDSNGSPEKIGDRTTNYSSRNYYRFPKDHQPEVTLENTLQPPSVKAWVNGLKTNNTPLENGCRTDANVQETKHPQKAKLPVRDRIRALVGYDDLINDGIQDHEFKEENNGHI